MRPPRPGPRSTLFSAAVVAVTAGALLIAPYPAGADPRPTVREGDPLPRGASDAPASAAHRALTAPETDLADDAGRTVRGYPREQVLAPDPENPADKSIKLGLTPYHAIAPKLNALQALGDRVSVEIAGRSAGGHRLYLVTVTAPETARQARAQARMRERIENAPRLAAKDRTLKKTYKTPVFFNNNIHGNEWEGTDAALRLIERLAKAKDTRTKDLLTHSRLYFNITANPDGRIAGTRTNASGFDMNRDFVTASQPEVRAMRRIQIGKQPAVMLDLHGYVNGTLIEPTTPPHGENYEYDLFLKNTYANALRMEAAVNGLGYTHDKDGVDPAQIPFRDSEEGWDDWPPVFTPQYAAFHGTVAAHTVEIPLQVNNAAYESLPVAELRRRSAINVDVAGAAMEATLGFVREKRSSLLADQIEVFRRGAAGAAQVPVSEETVPGVPGIGPEDVYTAEFPRAYVVPAGRTQRSATAAARLVDHLIANDIRVTRATAGFRLGGRTYAKGSYVVDMRQAKRGLANALLADGRDISDKVSVMYDISGWSLGRLWGATVVAAESGRVSALPVRPVRSAAHVGRVAPRGTLRLRLDSPQEIAALNSLTEGRRPGAAGGRRQCPRAVLGPPEGGGARPLARRGVRVDEGERRHCAAARPGRGGGLGGRAVRAAGDGLRRGPGVDRGSQRGLRLVAGRCAVRVVRSVVRRAERGRADGADRLPHRPRPRRRGRGRGRAEQRHRAAEGDGGRGQRGRQRRGARGERGRTGDGRRPRPRLRLRARLVHRPRPRGHRGAVVRHG